jgi:hypothetical protein
MSPWFRRRRLAAASQPEQEVDEPEASDPAPEKPREVLDSTAPLSPDRLDDALKRLRKEIPAPSEESTPGPSE